MAETLVVGVGSPHGDDQAGWHVAKQLQKLLKPTDAAHVVFRFASSPIEALHWLGDVQRLIACDAFRRRGGHASGAEPQRWRWPLPPEVEHTQWSGTHDVTLPMMLQLGETLELLPPSVIVWGIPMENAPEPMAKLAAVVEERCRTAAKQIASELFPSPSPRSGEPHA